MTGRPEKRSQRAEQKEKTRRRLLESTMTVIAREGLSGTTMGKVAREAGLSQGIVNFHFESKEKLLGEVLVEITEEYQTSWQEALEEAEADPGEQIVAVVHALFNERITKPEHLRCWFAFWGDAYARGLYRQIGSQVDEQTSEMLGDLCQELIESAVEISPEAREVASRLIAMVTGFWLMMVMRPEEVDLEDAVRACVDYLRGIFPEQIPADA
jgi:TetR/AcrR family transcriptional repressor of bet genes